jgi:hypothetical protein
MKAISGLNIISKRNPGKRKIHLSGNKALAKLNHDGLLSVIIARILTLQKLELQCTHNQ